jgi:two-component system OmpR family response regulator
MGRGEEVSQTKVLIVDVDRNVHERLRRALSFTGALVSGASGSESVLHRVELDEPDLIILDIPCQESDRWETLLHIREQLPDTPVIALTTPDDAGSTVDCLLHGADYSMTKPVRVRELQARIRALLRRSRRVEALTLAV